MCLGHSFGTMVAGLHGSQKVPWVPSERLCVVVVIRGSGDTTGAWVAPQMLW